VKLLARLNLGQRIVLVVALGALTYLLGIWISYQGKQFGWVAYAPLSSSTSGRLGGLTFGWTVLIWAGLTLVWVLLSLLVLGAKARRRDDQS
jgi:heme/copper-type cytochrome/quinol oxidase subunit 1